MKRKTRLPKGEGDAKTTGTYDPVATRKAVIEAAVKLFSLQGYAQTPVQQIVETAGLTKGAFYHHYESKEDVLLSIRDEIASRLLQNAIDAIEKYDTPQDQLRELVRTGVISVVKYKAYVTVYFQEFRALSKRGLAKIREQNDRQVEIMRDIISRGKEEGAFSQNIDIRVLTATIPAIINWAYRWYRPSGDLGVTELSDMLCELALYGVMSRDAPAA